MFLIVNEFEQSAEKNVARFAEQPSGWRGHIPENTGS
jgi:hypothetical protein